MTERGTLLGGRYELDQIIGRGGMAEVWRARDTRLVRDVAVKRLRVDLASDPTFQARFRREAQSAAGLNHPNIVAVYDTGEERDTKSEVMIPYIVMELVEGVTLREVLRDGRKIVPERALEFTAGVLDALAYSHRAGIIHRDIKPANVMLTPSGTVKVMDFGIARAVADTSATMTQTAAVIGTAQYLSPEQARGEKVDNRSDLYSVGCLLYELLCSEPPFKGDSPVSVAYQHVREAPIPPSQRDPEVTAAMDAITLKALAKSPFDRYQDAREFREDILRALNGQPVMASFGAPGDTPTTVMPANGNPRRASAAEVPAPTTAQAAVASEWAADPAATGSVATIDDEEDPKARKRRKALIITLSTLGVVLVAAIAWAAIAILNPSQPVVTNVAVPNVVGQEQASAEALLTQAGLEVKVESTPSEESQKGRVVSSDPAAETEVAKGSTVTIKVGAGPSTKAVPTLAGKTEAEARQALKDAGFTGEITVKDADPKEEPADAVKGNVVSSDPSAGSEVALSQAFTLKLATGTSPVPDFSGKTAAEAQTMATAAGFKVKLTVVEQVTTAQTADRVFDQSPAAGTNVLRDSGEITITVAKAESTATVPNMIGMSEEQALEALRNAGFTTAPRIKQVQRSDKTANEVFEQSATAGEKIAKDTLIELTIAIAMPTQSPSPIPSPSPSPTHD